jgi:hypothetical protein
VRALPFTFRRSPAPPSRPLHLEGASPTELAQWAELLEGAPAVERIKLLGEGRALRSASENNPHGQLRWSAIAVVISDLNGLRASRQYHYLRALARAESEPANRITWSHVPLLPAPEATPRIARPAPAHLRR